jgi:hypothetical protein
MHADGVIMIYRFGLKGTLNALVKPERLAWCTM